MGRTRQWLFSRLDALPSREIDAILFLDSSSMCRKETNPGPENTTGNRARLALVPEYPAALVLNYCSAFCCSHTEVFYKPSAMAQREKR